MKPVHLFPIGILLLGTMIFLIRAPFESSDIQTTLETRSLEILNFLKNKDFVALSQFVDPDKGLRFSPYGTLAASDQVFSKEAIKNLLQERAVYEFGVYDGSGFPIQKTFAEYFEEFVYDVDFMKAPKTSFDRRLGQGNTLNNIFDIYPTAHYTEFHFPGFDPQYEGMDWKSLRLIFEEKTGTWYLVGIAHDQWTI